MGKICRYIRLVPAGSRHEPDALRPSAAPPCQRPLAFALCRDGIDEAGRCPVARVSSKLGWRRRQKEGFGPDPEPPSKEGGAFGLSYSPRVAVSCRRFARVRRCFGTGTLDRFEQRWLEGKPL